MYPMIKLGNQCKKSVNLVVLVKQMKLKENSGTRSNQHESWKKSGLS